MKWGFVQNPIRRRRFAWLPVRVWSHNPRTTSFNERQEITVWLETYEVERYQSVAGTIEENGYALYFEHESAPPIPAVPASRRETTHE